MDVGVGWTFAGAAHTQLGVHLLTQKKDQVMMKPTYYQFYFIKSSHAEVKLMHTLETSPELQIIYRLR